VFVLNLKTLRTGLALAAQTKSVGRLPYLVGFERFAGGGINFVANLVPGQQVALGLFPILQEPMFQRQLRSLAGVFQRAGQSGNMLCCPEFRDAIPRRENAQLERRVINGFRLRLLDDLTFECFKSDPTDVTIFAVHFRP